MADADFLYNPQSKLFMSLDTPRSVKAKGEYAAKHNLGGLFTWTIDQDNGVLLNAAREGLGYEVQTQVVDMAPFYFSGMTAIDGVVPDDETPVDPQPEPTPDDSDVEPQPEPTPDEGETSGDTWDATATYMENDLVIWKGHQYKAGWWTVGDQPDLNCGVGQPWNDLGAI